MKDNQPELARQTELYNTIPSKFVDIAVTTGEVEFNLNALGSGPTVSLAGKRIRLRAQGTTVTYLASAAADVVMVAGSTGLILADGSVSERYYVPHAATIPLCVIGAGAGTLRIFYDD
jgi:hypothetical protein